MKSKRKNLSNINQATEWFEVLQTTSRSQTAVMRLGPSESTGEHAESHKDSEQILFLVEGILAAEIDSEHLAMKVGDIVIYPSGNQTQVHQSWHNHSRNFQCL